MNLSSLLCTLATLYLYAIFARIILSWIPVSFDSPFYAVASFLHRITEPLMAPVRQVIPPLRMGGAAIDLSPIVVILGWNLIVMSLVC